DAARANPQSTLPLVDLAQLYEASGNGAGAAATYREALARSPDDLVILNNLAYLLARDPSKLTEAGALAERAHRRAPRSPGVADTLGWILFQQGSLDRATQLLEQAARSSPANSTIQYHLGVVYARQGRRPEARKALEQALQGPRFAESHEAQQ